MRYFMQLSQHFVTLYTIFVALSIILCSTAQHMHISTL